MRSALYYFNYNNIFSGRSLNNDNYNNDCDNVNISFHFLWTVNSLTLANSINQHDTNIIANHTSANQTRTYYYDIQTKLNKYNPLDIKELTIK